LELGGVGDFGGTDRECSGVERTGEARFHRHAARQIDAAAAAAASGIRLESENDRRASAFGAKEALAPMARLFRLTRDIQSWRRAPLTNESGGQLRGLTPSKAGAVPETNRQDFPFA